jgi:hypothetical protein
MGLSLPDHGQGSASGWCPDFCCSRGPELTRQCEDALWRPANPTAPKLVLETLPEEQIWQQGVRGAHKHNSEEGGRRA